MTTILAPLDLSSATQTGPRTYRKQLLRKGTIHYPRQGGKTQRVDFTDQYLMDLAAAFRAGAYDNVPFVLAGADNAHTLDPTRFRGWLKAVEVTPEGLDGLLELSADAAELVDRTGGKLGVSLRIKPTQHVDGRTYPQAINHVLGTLDPRLQGPTLGLRAWEPLDLSAEDDGDVLDLMGAPYQEGSTMPKMLDLSALTDDQLDSLHTWAAVHQLDLSDQDDAPDDAEVVTPSALEDEPADNEPSLLEDADDEDKPEDDDPDDDGEGITDAELDALIDAELADMGADVGLSTPDDADDDPDWGGLDLSGVDHGTDGDERVADRRENARMRGELAVRDYAAAGVPAYLLDLARPILNLSDDDNDALDLSNPATDEQVDVRGIVRDMLDAVKGTIDLSGEQGHGHDEAEDQPGGTDLADAWAEFLENN